jgi:hypothetical protein
VPGLIAIFSFAACAMFLSWTYFRRYQITRRLLGVFNLNDAARMLGMIIVLPYLYLALPTWLVIGVFSLSTGSVIYGFWKPIMRDHTLILLTTLGLIGLDSIAVAYFGPASLPFFIVNNSVMVLIIAYVTNLWAQGGMKARDVTLLSIGLAIYDFVATSVLPLMSELMSHLAERPLAPMISWQLAPNSRMSIGLGDLLLATVFVLIARRAFGRRAGRVAFIVGLLALTSPFIFAGCVRALGAANFQMDFPVMTLLCPLMILQYSYWTRTLGRERTTQDYLRAEPLSSSERFSSALRLSGSVSNQSSGN